MFFLLFLHNATNTEWQGFPYAYLVKLQKRTNWSRKSKRDWYTGYLSDDIKKYYFTFTSACLKILNGEETLFHSHSFILITVVNFKHYLLSFLPWDCILGVPGWKGSNYQCSAGAFTDHWLRLTTTPAFLLTGQYAIRGRPQPLISPS